MEEDTELRDALGRAFVGALQHGLPRLRTLDLRCALATALPASDASREGSCWHLRRCSLLVSALPVASLPPLSLTAQE